MINVKLQAGKFRLTITVPVSAVVAILAVLV
jgi:hypothetical protein